MLRIVADRCSPAGGRCRGHWFGFIVLILLRFSAHAEPSFAVEKASNCKAHLGTCEAGILAESCLQVGDIRLFCKL